MAQILSFSHIECIVDGHRMVGFADETRPIEFPNPDLFEEMIGKDGGLYGSTTGMFGGLVVFRLLPTSPSVRWFLQRREEWTQAQLNGTALPILSGSYQHLVQGARARLEGGIIKTAPPMLEPGVTYEGAIYFERIIAGVDGAVFRAPLTSA